MYQICVYIPESSVEKVKKALFDAGAGKIGNYDHCCWQSKGIGQFRPLANSQPTLGEQNKLEHVNETKVELVCKDELVEQIIDALKASHPYEEPAYTVIKTENF